MTKRKQTATFGAFTVDVVKEAATGRAQYLVCLRRTVPLLRDDNRIAPCVQCGDDLQYSPSSPSKPRKICADCLAILALKFPGERRWLATERQVAYVQAHNKQRRH